MCVLCSCSLQNMIKCLAVCKRLPQGHAAEFTPGLMPDIAECYFYVSDLQSHLDLENKHHHLHPMLHQLGPSPSSLWNHRCSAHLLVYHERCELFRCEGHRFETNSFHRIQQRSLAKIYHPIWSFFPWEYAPTSSNL